MSVRPSVCLSVRHSRMLCQNGNKIFTEIDPLLCFSLFKVYSETQKGLPRARALNKVDHKRPLRTLIRYNCVFWNQHTNLSKRKPILAAINVGRDSSFTQYVVCADNHSHRVPWRGSSNSIGCLP